MNSKDEAPQGISRSAITLFAAAAFLSYVLLLGPAVRLHDSSPVLVQRAIEIIYAPMAWLHKNAPGAVLDAYVDLWRR